MRVGVLVSFLTVVFLSTSLVFSKGKKPPQSKDQEESQSHEKILPEKLPPSQAESAGESVESRMPEQSPVVQGAPPSQSKEEVSQEISPPQAVAQETSSQVPEGAVVHVVWVWQESKDCLWTLAKKYYKDPWQWKRIYSENRNTILNPNVIFPKQKIIIPPPASVPKGQ